MRGAQINAQNGGGAHEDWLSAMLGKRVKVNAGRRPVGSL
jgi:hypothetical protein